MLQEFKRYSKGLQAVLKKFPDLTIEKGKLIDKYGRERKAAKLLNRAMPLTANQ